MAESRQWTEWGVQWTSPFGAHVTVEESREAAETAVRLKRLQAGCASQVVRREVRVSEWKEVGRASTALSVGGGDPK